LLGEVDNLASAIDHCKTALGIMPAPPVEGQPPAATGPDALKPAIAALRRTCAGLNDLYDKREHILLGSI
jgi:hypothetical protein